MTARPDSSYESMMHNAQRKAEQWRQRADRLADALEAIFACPNWENRIGPWKDVNAAVKSAYVAFQRYKDEVVE